jgi:uncharacterized protein YeaO (DUF488 family)
MSRITLNDGVTPDKRIKTNRYNIWRKDLAPSGKLLGDYYKRGLSFEDFEKRFNIEMKDNEFLKSLAKLSLTQNITFLCKEKKADKCHRRLLVNICKKFEPNLKCKIK